MLEIRTILIVMSLGSLLTAFALCISCGARFQDGLAKWVAALVLQSFTWGMYALHGIAPVIVTETLADSLLAMSWMLKLASLLEFQHRMLPKSLLWGAGAISIVLLLCLAGLGHERELLLFRGFIFSVSTLGIAWLAWHIPDLLDRRVRWLMTGIYAAVAVGFLARAAAAIWLPGVLPDPLAATGFQAFTFLLGYSFIILSAFCIMLMHKERADNKNYLLASTDPLTGVYNRRTFMDLADKLLAHAARTGSPAALLMIDIDHFKRVNDVHGHSAGDEALKETATRVQACLRKEDLLVRFGGEEFCVFLPGSDAAGAVILAERIRTHVAEMPLRASGQVIHLTVSIGVAMADPKAVRMQETLFSHADRALYEAKGAGRNRVILSAAA